jgi:transposase
MGKAGPECSICSHNRRVAIKIALESGMGTRQAAQRFQVSRDALQRHARNQSRDIY